MTSDQINAAFEASGAAFQFLNVRRLWRDRKIAGISPVPTVFFTYWGVWNLFYYPSLHQYWSLAAGLGLVIVNTIWLFLLWKFGRSATPT